MKALKNLSQRKKLPNKLRLSSTNLRKRKLLLLLTNSRLSLPMPNLPKKRLKLKLKLNKSLSQNPKILRKMTSRRKPKMLNKSQYLQLKKQLKIPNKLRNKKKRKLQPQSTCSSIDFSLLLKPRRSLSTLSYQDTSKSLLLSCLTVSRDNFCLTFSQKTPQLWTICSIMCIKNLSLKFYTN